MDFANIVYIVCATTSLACAGLLARAFWKSKHRLLLWTGLCFFGLALNNVLLVADRILFPTQVDLSLPRGFAALIGFTLLVYGLVLDTD